MKGDIVANGNLTADGDTIEIAGNLTVEAGVKFNGSTKNNLNITGTFTNNGTSIIDITQGVVNLGNVTNDGKLNITTHAKSGQKSIIHGDIINKKGNLNITDNNSNAEIEIGGNISQKKGNLTISSDKINIANPIKIQKGIDEKTSSSGDTNVANLTIKTKELKLAGDLDISNFDKAEIVAKGEGDLVIGNSSDNGSADAKKVTFSNVKDSKISAEGHGVKLNSNVETSSGDSSTENGSDGNNIGLTISAKDVTVNSNITSHKTVNISASEGGITTKAGTTINATTGSVEVTAKTGDIKGGIESTSGNVNITASGDTLKVSNITGQNVTVTVASGAVTTTEGSTINATTGEANITSATGTIDGTVSGGTVNVTATTDSLTVKGGAKINATEGTATLTASSGKLTTEANSAISGANGVTASSQSGDISGTISGKTVSVTATTDSLTVKGGAKINATEGAATLTATKGTLTTDTGSNITSTKGQVDLSAQDGSIAGQISAANVTLNTTGTLTTVVGSSINANEGTLVINAKDAELNGKASGNRTEVNATNASGSGSVTAKTSSSVNITGDL
ncbi:TPA: beta strand repeat-containing protein, partial [Haemophilus influenzae]